MFEEKQATVVTPLRVRTDEWAHTKKQTVSDRTKTLCPSHEGGNNYCSAPFSQRTRLYTPSRPTCNENDLVSGRSADLVEFARVAPIACR
jgi:hypothetical protein